jgi:hypothetical protein
MDICLNHGLDYIKVINENNNFNIEKNIDLFQDVSIAVSAFVTSYARVYMLTILKEILKTGGSVYYMDTDSIVLDRPLDSKWLGKSLGKFKLEYVIDEAYFISNKTYCLILKNGKTIIKCKGINTDSLTVKEFKDMYFTAKDTYASKISSKTNLSKGSVTIEEKQILIQHDVYRKREKIFNSKGLWINTKPLLYNNVVKSIILKK